MNAIGRLTWMIVALPLFTTSAFAQVATSWPAKPVKFIVPAAAGGGLDAAARFVSDALSKRLGQPFIIQNTAGIPEVGTAAAAKAPPDGYTILTATGGPISILPSLRNDLPYNVATDLAPVGLINESVSVLVVNPNVVPAKTLSELIQLMKDNPNKYDYATNGVGSESHLYMSLLQLRTGAQAHHVPYKAGAQQMTSLLGGEVGVAFINSSTVMPLILGGSVRALAVVSANRLADIPDVPTVNEIVPTYGSYSTWQGLFVPAGTPKPIIDKLANALTDFIASPEAAADMKRIGSQPRTATPEQFGALIKRDTAAWADVIKAANIRLE